VGCGLSATQLFSVETPFTQHQWMIFWIISC
jgi:hypothetical protein